MPLTEAVPRAAQSPRGWSEKQERVAVGLPEVLFGEQLPSGRVELVARGVLTAKAISQLQKGVDPRRGERMDGPRAPRCAWPS